MKKKKKQKIVFLITEDRDNYKAHKTVPQFAEMLKKNMDMMLQSLWAAESVVLIVIHTWRWFQKPTCSSSLQGALLYHREAYKKQGLVGC